MSSLHPVAGPAGEILALLVEWDAASDPGPLVVETSGSTGVPKRVLISRSAMRASADATHARLGGPGQWLLALPPTYVAGLQVLFRSVRADTEPVLMTDRLRPSVEAMTGARRYVSLVPTQVHRMLQDGDETQALTRFDGVLVGGAALDREVREQAAQTGVRIVTTYGMSETCGGCVYDGRPLDGVEVATEGGRIKIRGPVLFDGYQGDVALSAEVLRNGWFLTQDLGHISEQGRVVLGGRTDDVVITGGLNVPAGAVAESLERHRGVRAAAVVGVPDEEWGEVVVAVAVTDVALDELREHVARQHPRSFAPRRLVRVDALPLLPNGKVDRLAVERLARG